MSTTDQHSTETQLGPRVTISHTAEEGTLATGNTRPLKDTIKTAGFRWSRTIGAWYLPQSRDRAPQTSRIDRLAAALREQGARVTVEIDTARRPVAEVEADRAQRAETRAEGLAAKAQRLDAASDQTWQQSERIRDGIPMGQPILVGHHSERRHRRDLERMDRLDRKSFDLASEAKETARRAEAATETQSYRESVPVTLRRIKKLETELRDVQRRIHGTGKAIYGTAEPATGAYRDRMLDRQTELTEKITHWRGQIAESGAKIWGPDDFTKGDLALTDQGDWVPVLRVNPKSLRVPHPFIGLNDRPWTVPYDKIRGRKPPTPPAGAE